MESLWLQLPLRFTATLVLLAGPVPLVLWGLSSTAAEHKARGHGGEWILAIALWSALQVAVATLLGALHLYRLPALLVAEMGLLAVGLCLGKGVLPPWPSLPAARLARVALALLGLHVGVLLSTAAALMARFPTNYDTLTYHLPHVVNWVQNGSFVRMPIFPVVTCFPFSWQALSGLTFLTTGWDMLALLPNLAAWLLLGLAVYAVARRVKAQPTAAAVGAALVLGIPDLLADVGTAQNDLAVAAFSVSAVYGLLLYPRAPRSAVLLLAVCGGMLLGLRPPGIAYPIAAAILGLPFVLVRRPAILADRSALRAFGLVAILALALGSYWYLRNWAEMGNPLGNVEVSLGGRVLFDGEVGAERFRGTSLVEVVDLRRSVDRQWLVTAALDYLGFPFLVLLGSSAMAVVGLARGSSGLARMQLLWLGLVAAAFFLGYVSTPASASAIVPPPPELTKRVTLALRYGYPWMALLGALAAAGWTALGARASAALLVLPWTGWILESVVSDRGVPVLLPLLMSLLFLVLYLLFRRLRARVTSTPVWPTTAAVIAVGLGLATFAWCWHARTAGWARQEPYLRSFLAASLADDDTLYCVTRANTYVLYGPGHTRRVAYRPAEFYAEWAEGQHPDATWLAVGPREARDVPLLNAPPVFGVGRLNTFSIYRR